MPTWSRAIGTLVAVTFTAACYKDVEVRRPAEAVVVPYRTAEGPRKCAAEEFSNENDFARCLGACDGAWRVSGVACGDARIEGSECATVWVTRTERRASPGGFLGVIAASVGGGLLTVYVLLASGRGEGPRPD